MSVKKETAIDICGNLSRENKMDYQDYLTVMDVPSASSTLWTKEMRNWRLFGSILRMFR